MQLFNCGNCSQPAYFENVFCVNCGVSLGFHAENMQLTAFNPGDAFRYCANYQQAACNWLVPINNNTPFCQACDLNRTIPDLSKPEFVLRWNKIEVAKRRLIYSIFQMKLPLISKKIDNEKGLALDFVADLSSGPEHKILTGYENGLITLNIAEADDIEREMARNSMHELYRTLLGHFRHEIGHFYWERLVDGSDRIEKFRLLFGDERADYDDSLKKYYQNGSPLLWNEQFISAYACSHPWEDWAESWAHYMHIADTLETAYSFGLSVDPLVVSNSFELKADIKENPYHVRDFEIIFNNWLPLTFAMNSLNRSMGLNDIYPFVISNPAKEKLKFIHEIVFSQF